MAASRKLTSTSWRRQVCLYSKFHTLSLPLTLLVTLDPGETLSLGVSQLKLVERTTTSAHSCPTNANINSRANSLTNSNHGNTDQRSAWRDHARQRMARIHRRALLGAQKVDDRIQRLLRKDSKSCRLRCGRWQRRPRRCRRRFGRQCRRQ